MLSNREKERLYRVIVSVIGEDASIKNVTKSFNMKTVASVETMVATSNQCNENMESLVSGLLTPAAFRGTGWLLKILKLANVVIPKRNLKGLGCTVMVKARWKSYILASTI